MLLGLWIGVVVTLASGELRGAGGRSVRGVAGQGGKWMARRRRVEPTEEWAELKLLLEWSEQIEYERIRGDSPVGGKVDHVEDVEEPRHSRGGRDGEAAAAARAAFRRRSASRTRPRRRRSASRGPRARPRYHARGGPKPYACSGCGPGTNRGRRTGKCTSSTPTTCGCLRVRSRCAGFQAPDPSGVVSGLP